MWTSETKFRVMQELGLNYALAWDIQNRLDDIRETVTQGWVQGLLDELAEIDLALREGANSDGIADLGGDIAFHPGGKSYGYKVRQRVLRERLASLLGLDYLSSYSTRRG